MDEEKEVMVIAFIDAWYILNFKSGEVLSGPHQDFEDAQQYCKTRAFRVAQGWAP